MRHGIKIGILSALWAAVVCATASAQTTLRYKFKEGEKLQYVMEQKMKMTMNIMNMEIDTKMNMVIDMTWHTLGVNRDGSAQMQIKVTQVKMSMDGPTGLVDVDSMQKDEPDDAIAKVFHKIVKATATMEMTGLIQTTGAMKDIKVSEETIKAMKSLPGADKLGDVLSPEAFKSMVSNLVFPADAVAKGKTWTNQTEAKTPIGKTISENTYTYDGPVPKESATLERISIKPNVKIEPDPNAPIKIELKETKGSGQILFDNKTGRLIESVTEMDMKMEMELGGMTIPQNVVQTLTYRLNEPEKSKE